MADHIFGNYDIKWGSFYETFYMYKFQEINIAFSVIPCCYFLCYILSMLNIIQVSEHDRGEN